MNPGQDSHQDGDRARVERITLFAAGAPHAVKAAFGRELLAKCARIGIDLARGGELMLVHPEAFLESTFGRKRRRTRFDEAPAARARASDPETSHEAAERAPSSEQTRRLLEALVAAPLGLTAEQAHLETGIAYASTSTELTRIRDAGWARRYGTRETRSGRQAGVNVITQDGLRAVGEARRKAKAAA